MLERRSIILLVAIVVLTLAVVVGCVSSANSSFVIDFSGLLS